MVRLNPSQFSLTLLLLCGCGQAGNAPAPIIESGGPPLTSFTLTTRSDLGNGTGNLTFNGTVPDCNNATCNAQFESGTEVELVSTADTGSRFAFWSGNPDCYDGKVTLNANISCDAIFFLVDPKLRYIICDEIVMMTAGERLALEVYSADPDPGDTVSLNVVGLPVTAEMIPGLPVAGNPVSSIFQWTPTSTDVGQHVILFKATTTSDTQCPLTINVTEA